MQKNAASRLFLTVSVFALIANVLVSEALAQVVEGKDQYGYRTFYQVGPTYDSSRYGKNSDGTLYLRSSSDSPAARRTESQPSTEWDPKAKFQARFTGDYMIIEMKLLLPSRSSYAYFAEQPNATEQPRFNAHFVVVPDGTEKVWRTIRLVYAADKVPESVYIGTRSGVKEIPTGME